MEKVIKQLLYEKLELKYEHCLWPELNVYFHMPSGFFLNK